jgi:hypothetical protein
MIDSDINDPTIQIIPSPGRYYVFGIGVPIMQISFFASLYVLYRCFKIYRLKGDFGPTIRYPFYMAVIDIILYIGHMNNQGYGIIWGHTRPMGLGCSMTAFYVAFGVFMNMYYTTIVAANTYLVVYRGNSIDTGKYEWKSILLCAILSIISAAVGAPFSGPNNYWCYFNQEGTKLFAWITAILEIGLFQITAICYFFVIQKVYSIKPIKEVMNDMMSSVDHSKRSIKSTVTAASVQDKRLNKFEDNKKKATRKMMSYTLNYFLQWGGSVPYVLGHLFDYRPDW